jgi:putative ABC transport system permease protein
VSLWESLKTSWQSIIATKLRSGLTVLGISIGIAAVVFLVGMGEGQSAQMTAMFQDLGADALYVASTSGRTSPGSLGNLTIEDAEALADPTRAPAIKLVAPTISRTVLVQYGNEKVNISCTGVTPEIATVRKYPVEDGFFISDNDVKRRTSVAVLGHQTAQDLFLNQSPLGQSIRIDQRKFQVIGVLEEMGGRWGDSFVLIPLTTMQAKIVTQRTALGHPVQQIAVQAVSTDRINEAMSQIKAILRERHRLRNGEEDDFDIVNMTDVLSSMQESLATFSLFLGFVGAIALVVGGIGIMNIMLVSVTERTREIGIRKAVGAKRRNILSQFLMESSMLSLTGGILGVIAAFLLSVLVSSLSISGMGGPPGRGSSLSILISPGIIIVALTISTAVGLVSGTYPAYRAASLDPITSLRHE